MPLIELVIVLAIVGVIVWAILKYCPMPVAIQRVILIVAVVGCVLYALSCFGIGIGSFPTPRVHGY